MHPTTIRTSTSSRARRHALARDDQHEELRVAEERRQRHARALAARRRADELTLVPVQVDGRDRLADRVAADPEDLREVVDPALVAHYFGSKRELFLAVVELLFEPETVLPALARRRTPRSRRTIRAIRARRRRRPGAARAGGRDRARRYVGAGRGRGSTRARVAAHRRRYRAALGADDAELRGSLVGSQVVGLVTAPYIVGLEPLVSLPPVADATHRRCSAT